MSNIKISGKTYNNVNKVKFVNADDASKLVSFSSGLAVNVTFMANGSTWAIQSIQSGGYVTVPNTPFTTGKMFKGWYTAETGGTKIDFPYTPTGDVTLYAQYDLGLIATVNGLGNATPSTVTFTVDDNFVFTDGTFTDSYGNTFIKIPTMYRKINTVSNGQITSWSISNSKVDDDYKPFPVFLKEDGVTVMPWVGFGKGWNNSSTLVNCKSTSTTITNMSLENARATLSQYNNDGYQLMDWMFFSLWQCLIICKMKTINTNSGSGITTDGLGIYWGAVGFWIDGGANNNGTILICTKPSKYVSSPTSSTDGYVALSYKLPTSSSSGQCISKLGYDSNYPFFNFPSAYVSNSSYNTYYCDYIWGSTGNSPFRSCVGSSYADYGAFYLSLYGSWSAALGVRLCYRPLDE